MVQRIKEKVDVDNKKAGRDKRYDLLYEKPIPGKKINVIIHAKTLEILRGFLKTVIKAAITLITNKNNNFIIYLFCGRGIDGQEVFKLSDDEKQMVQRIKEKLFLLANGDASIFRK
jgi:hypothetical protein